MCNMTTRKVFDALCTVLHKVNYYCIKAGVTMKKTKIKKYIILIVLLIIAFIYAIWENNALQITFYTYSNSKLPDSFKNYRIVQLSDLHNKKFGDNGKKLADKVLKLNPNIVVITGDIIDSNHCNINTAIDTVKKIADTVPVYYVNGNHELLITQEKQNELYSGLEHCGVIILHDTYTNLKINKDEISLIGLSDDNLSDISLNKILESVDTDYKILLAHEPQYIEDFSNCDISAMERAGNDEYEYIEDFSNCDIDLIFSGHAHGGQVRLPFIGGLVAPDQGFFPDYTEGVFEKNNTSMIISRGLGNSIIPIRIANRPEIVCVDLK